MSLLKTKQNSFQLNDSFDRVKIKCVDALESAGFKNIKYNATFNEVSGDYSSLTTKGKINISIFYKEPEQTVIEVQTTAHADNIYAWFSSPNDKLLNKFRVQLN